MLHGFQIHLGLTKNLVWKIATFSQYLIIFTFLYWLKCTFARHTVYIIYINTYIQDSLYLESAYFQIWNIYSTQVILCLLGQFFQIRPWLPAVDSVKVVTFVAEFAVAVPAGDDIAQVTIFGLSLPHFKFSLALWSFVAFSLKYANVCFPVALDFFISFTSSPTCFHSFISARDSKAFFQTSMAISSFSAFCAYVRVLASNSASASLIFSSSSSNKFSVGASSFTSMPMALISAEIFILYRVRIKLYRPRTDL